LSDDATKPLDRAHQRRSEIGMLIFSGFVLLVAAGIMIVNYGWRDSPATMDSGWKSVVIFAVVGAAGYFLIEKVTAMDGVDWVANTTLSFLGVGMFAFRIEHNWTERLLSAASLNLGFLIAVLFVLAVDVLSPKKWFLRKSAFLNPSTVPLALVAVPLVTIVVCGSSLISLHHFDDSLFPPNATDRQVGLLPLWHVVDTLPLVDVDDTIGWEKPVNTTSTQVGWLMLVVKLTFLLTVVDLAQNGLKRLRGSKQSNDD
jgi:hypothetical protein